MPKYRYTAINKAGKKIKGTIEADNLTQFNLILKGKNEYLISFKNEEDSKNFSNSYKISKKNLYMLCKQYYSMLLAGINSVKALEILYNEAKNNKIKKILLEVYEQIQKGRSLSEAMNSLNGVFPNFMINIIKAGEISGNLTESIKRLTIQYEKDIKIKNKVISSIIYPIFLLIASIISILLIFGFTLPKIIGLVGNIDELNIISKSLFSIVMFLKNNWLIFIISILIFSVILIIYFRTDHFKYKFSKMKVKSLFIGKIYITMISGIFIRTLGSLFLSGVPLITAIEMAGDVIDNRYISNILKGVIEDVTKGTKFSEALIKTKIFPSNVTSIISVGEETGSLEEILIQTSDYYDMIAEDSIKKIVSMIEPIIIIVFGIIIFIILMGTFLPIYSVYNSISGI